MGEVDGSQPATADVQVSDFSDIPGFVAAVEQFLAAHTPAVEDYQALADVAHTAIPTAFSDEV